MQYVKFGRKYDAAAVTADLSCLPNKNSLIQQAKIIMARLLLRGRRITVQLFVLKRRDHGNFGREIFNVVYVKLGKAIHSKTKVLRCSTSESSSWSRIVKQQLQ
ncbi:hypothetical protein AVEN_114084-1 [Araneus ventricosus]|nr:hypothetical protein AVEN_175955-1 [Araneus ventricosus]GBL69965.1 hypothetical protein AVEN_114084-1 [Araneus ventricosus]